MAASRNEVTSGARMNAQSRNRVMPSRLWNRSLRLASVDNSAAANSASPAFPSSQPNAVATGTPVGSWAQKCAGISASRIFHQRRTGARTSAARRIALGGQNIEIGISPGVSAKPIRVPAKYPAATRTAYAASLNQPGRGGALAARAARAPPLSLASSGCREIDDDEPIGMHCLSRDEAHESAQCATFDAASPAPTSPFTWPGPEPTAFRSDAGLKPEITLLPEARRRKRGRFRTLTLAHGMRSTLVPCAEVRAVSGRKRALSRSSTGGDGFDCQPV